MNAIIFAAGLGSRLRPLTDVTPKPLIEVGGRTMLERTATNLRHAGAQEIVANVHHLGQKIVNYISDNALNIKISDETDMLLDTGGGMLQALKMLPQDQPVIVHNADIATDLDLAAMLRAHIDNGADITLAVSQRETSRVLLFGQEGMRGWLDRRNGQTIPERLDYSALTQMAFSGIHIINPATVLPVLEEYKKHLGTPVFPVVPFYTRNAGRLHILPYSLMPDDRWVDIGKPETLAKARELFG